MSTPKPAKTSESSYTVKFSNKTGGAYADMKAVIQSERKNWDSKPSQGDSLKNTNGSKAQPNVPTKK
ncbi:hypothetical protein [Persicitalea sp.]|uniref:hypothetical protein n=1 Tax=Persicitalea sp. TaxID=3100273 RepID=UPI003592F152